MKMKNNETSIDDLFKSELGSYTEAPPPAAWDLLERKLEHKKNPGASYTRYGFVALASLLLVVSIPVIRNMKNNSSPGSQIESRSTSSTNNNITESANKPYSKVQDNSTVQNSKSIIDQKSGANTTAVNHPSVDAALTPPGKNLITDNNIGNARNPAFKKIDDKFANSVKRPAYQNKNHQAGIFDNSVNSGSTGIGQPVHETTKGLPVDNDALSGAANPKDLSAQSQQQETVKTETAKAETPKTETQKEDALRKHKIDSMIARAQQLKPTAKAKVPFDRFEFGVKAGFERGFDNEASKKGVFSPYLQYNISPKLSIMTQPSVKYASYNFGAVGAQNSYYKELNDSSVRAGQTLPLVLTGGEIPYYLTVDTFRQAHDSIVKSYTQSGTYMEFDIPILLKYRVARGFSIYGGLDITYSKLTGFTENTSTKQLVVNDTDYIFTRPGQSVPIPSTASVITYIGRTPISDYKNPYPTPPGSLLRYGYMFGFSYEFTKRWMLDGLVQQAMVKQNLVGGYDSNAPLSAPYFRFTIGYKLIK